MDFQEIQTLLEVIKLAAEHNTKYRDIIAAAQARLDDIMAEAKDE